jgi:hypothetical protein
MQKIVGDELRPPGDKDPTGVDQARRQLDTAYYRELLNRPSVATVVEDARPYRELFPLPWPADQDEV